MWYVLSAVTGDVIATCDAEPDDRDLASRGEVAVFQEENIPLDRCKAERTTDGWRVTAR